MTYVPATMMAAQLLAGTAPPPVAQSSAVGSGSKAARDDHTHQSSVQAERLLLTPDAAGKVPWAFPQAFAAGVMPVVVVTAETPDGANYFNVASIIQGTVSNTGCQIKVLRLNQSLIGGLTSIFSLASGPVWVELWARKSTSAS